MEIGSTPYEKTNKIISDLETQLSKPNIDVNEYQSIQEDLTYYHAHKIRFENARASIGEKGLQAYNLWEFVSGQRFIGMEAGEVMIPSIIETLTIYEIEGEEKERMLRFILHIDRLYRSEMRKKQPKSKGGFTPPKEGVH